MLSLVILSLPLVLLGLVAAGFVLAVRRNMGRGMLVRTRLESRLAGLPLRHMLAVRGISATEYLFTRPVVDIERQLRNCESCAHGRQCARHCTTRQWHAVPEFCPNGQGLMAMG